MRLKAVFAPIFASLLSAAAIVFATAAPATASLVYQGTWKGHIGPQPVMVCLSPLAAQYYHLSQRRGLWLEATSSSQDALRLALQTGQLALTEKVHEAGSFELRPLAQWRLEPDAQGGLRGTWRDLAGNKNWPIQLLRVSASGSSGQQEGACDAAFYQPIEQAYAATSQPRQHQGHPYQELRTPVARAVQLPGTTPGIMAFNAYVRQWLGEQAVQDYECMRMGGSTWSRALEPVFWTDTTLVLRDSTPEVYCGGAHRFAAVSYLTWNLDAGTPITVWDWLQGGAKATSPAHNPSGDAIRTPLRALLEKHDPRNTPRDDCAEETEYMEIAQPYPSPQGLVFDTLHSQAMRACNDSISLSWSQLQPLLTPAGKAAMQHWRKVGR